MHFTRNWGTILTFSYLHWGTFLQIQIKLGLFFIIKFSCYPHNIFFPFATLICRGWSGHTNFFLFSPPSALPCIGVVSQASDGEGSHTANVRVSVRDANNNVPVFSKKEYLAAVQENSAIGMCLDELVIYLWYFIVHGFFCLKYCVWIFLIWHSHYKHYQSFFEIKWCSY